MTDDEMKILNCIIKEIISALYPAKQKEIRDNLTNLMMKNTMSHEQKEMLEYLIKK